MLEIPYLVSLTTMGRRSVMTTATCRWQTRICANALFVAMTMFALFGNARAAPWDSCDEKWAKAWKNCEAEAAKRIFSNFGCYPLPGSFYPNCSPSDPFVKQYPGGRKEYEENQRNIAERKRHAQENIALISVSNYRYASHEGGISFTAVISNRHPAGKLNDITMSCTVVANKSVELWNGSVVSSPNIVSGGTARVQLFFEEKKTNIIDLALGSGPKRERFTVISTQGQRVNGLSISCQPLSISVGELLRGGGYYSLQ